MIIIFGEFVRTLKYTIEAASQYEVERSWTQMFTSRMFILDMLAGIS